MTTLRGPAAYHAAINTRISNVFRCCWLHLCGHICSSSRPSPPPPFVVCLSSLFLVPTLTSTTFHRLLVMTHLRHVLRPSHHLCAHLALFLPPSPFRSTNGVAHRLAGRHANYSVRHTWVWITHTIPTRQPPQASMTPPATPQATAPVNEITGHPGERHYWFSSPDRSTSSSTGGAWLDPDHHTVPHVVSRQPTSPVSIAAPDIPHEHTTASLATSILAFLQYSWPAQPPPPNPFNPNHTL